MFKSNREKLVVVFLVLVSIVISTMYFYSASFSRGTAQMLESQIQELKIKQNLLNIDFFHDGEGIFILLKKDKVGNQNGKFLGIKIGDAINGQETPLLSVIEASNYFVFKMPGAILQKGFYIKIVTSEKETFFTI